MHAAAIKQTKLVFDMIWNRTKIDSNSDSISVRMHFFCIYSNSVEVNRCGWWTHGMRCHWKTESLYRWGTTSSIRFDFVKAVQRAHVDRCRPNFYFFFVLIFRLRFYRTTLAVSCLHNSSRLSVHLTRRAPSAVRPLIGRTIAGSTVTAISPNRIRFEFFRICYATECKIHLPTGEKKSHAEVKGGERDTKKKMPRTFHKFTLCIDYSFMISILNLHVSTGLNRCMHHWRLDRPP